MSLEFRFPPDPGQLRSLRRSVRDELGRRAIVEDVVDDVLLVLDELVSNAIEHADDYRGSDHLSVSLRVVGGGVVLDFEDPEMPDATVDWLASALRDRGVPPPLDNERGRGLFLISIRVHELSVVKRVGGGLHLRGTIREDRD